MSNYLPFDPSQNPSKSGNDLSDVITFLHTLIQEYRSYLELKELYAWDKLTIAGAPACCIAFDTASVSPTSLGHNCNEFRPQFNIFLYFESLTPGMDTQPHLSRLYNLMRVIYDNSSLYNLCATNPVSIEGMDLVARRIESDVYLTGQLTIVTPIRFCRTRR